MLKRFAIVAGLTALVAYPILLWIWKSYGFPIDVPYCGDGTNAANNNNCPPEHIYFVALWQIGKLMRDSAFVTALATIVMAAFTGTLWRSTKNLWLSSEKQFAALNRPELTIHAVEVQHVVDGDKADKPNRLGAALLCFNKGRTTAINVEVRGQILKMRNLGVDIQRKIVKTFSLVESGQKMRTEITSDWTFNDLPHSVSLRRDTIDSGMKPSMFCIGTISYFDLNESRREVGFCYILTIDHLGERWESAKSPAHEYDY